MGSGMLAAEHVARGGDGRANDELADYENAWRDVRGRQGPARGPQRQAAMVEVRHHHRRGAWRSRHVGNTLRFLAVRHACRHGKPDRNTLMRRRRTHREIPSPKPDGKTSFDKLPPSFSPTPIMRRISRSISRLPTGTCRRRPSSTCMRGLQIDIARPASMSGSRRLPVPAFDQHPGLPFTAKRLMEKDERQHSLVPPEGGGGPNSGM